MEINKLPSEVLQEIFKLTAHLDRSLASIHNSLLISEFDILPGAYSWLVLTAVCRRWFEECVACKALWARVLIPSIHTMSFLRLCLLRAGPYPLSVSYLQRPGVSVTSGLSTYQSTLFNPPIPPVTGLLEEVFSEAEHIQELHAHFSTTVVHDSLLKQGKPASLGPQLHSLSLSASTTGILSRLAPPRFLSADAPDFPALRYLQLRHPFSPSIPAIGRLSALVHLEVEARLPSDPVSGTTVAFSDILECLGALKHLETLLWCDPYGAEGTGALEHLHLPTITLKRLRNIKLSAPTDFARALMAHLRTHRDASLKLVDASAKRRASSVEEMLAPLLEWFALSAPEIAEPRVLHVSTAHDTWTIGGSKGGKSRVEPGGLRNASHSMDRPAGALVPGLHPHFTLSIYWPGWTGSMVDFAQGMMGLGKCVRRLELLTSTVSPFEGEGEGENRAYGDVVNNFKGWAECLPGLTELCVRYSLRPPERVRALPPADLAALSGHAGSSGCLWPDLETLQLRQVMLRAPRGQGAYKLWEVLRRREEGGCARLKELILVEPLLRNEEPALLRTFVEKVSIRVCECHAI